MEGPESFISRRILPFSNFDQPVICARTFESLSEEDEPPMNKIMCLRVLAMLGFLWGVSNGSQAQVADAQLDSFFKNYLEEHFRQRPLDATRLGDHRFDHLLDDISRKAQDDWSRHARRTLKALPKQVDFAKLSRAGQIDFEIFQHDLTTDLWLAENSHPFETDPRIYNEYLNDSVYMLLVQSTRPKETNIANCIARMSEFPKIVAAAKENLRNPPQQLAETAIRQNHGAIAFYEKEIFDLAGETRQSDALKASAARVAVLLKDYQKFLEQDLLPRAHGDWRIGKRKFARKLELVLDAGLTAEQVFADAETEFTRVVTEMSVIARHLWSKYFPKAPLPPDDAEGRSKTIRTILEAIGHEHGKPEELVRDARTTVNGIKTFIREHDFLRLPEPDHCQVIEMPEFKRGNSIAYLDSAPPLDPDAASLYAISPPPSDWDAPKVESYLSEYNRHMLQILTIHEAYPGHYVQLEYSNRAGSFIRRVLQSGVYIEGWAVYTEQTMLDQGYGNGDLALRLSQLKFYLRAVANAVLDHKMHCTAMTDDEAFRFLTENVFQSEGEARLKIIRAKQSSTQLSTYFVGRMAHYRLRQRIERELGDKFSLGRFHEAVLSEGSVPVKYLPELVRARLEAAR